MHLQGAWAAGCAALVGGCSAAGTAKPQPPPFHHPLWGGRAGIRQWRDFLGTERGRSGGNSQCGSWDELVERRLSMDPPFFLFVCFKDYCITRETRQTSRRGLAKAPSSGCIWTRGTGRSPSSKTASASVRARVGRGTGRGSGAALAELGVRLQQSCGGKAGEIEDQGMRRVGGRLRLLFNRLGFPKAVFQAFSSSSVVNRFRVAGRSEITSSKLM